MDGCEKARLPIVHPRPKPWPLPESKNARHRRHDGGRCTNQGGHQRQSRISSIRGALFLVLLREPLPRIFAVDVGNVSIACEANSYIFDTKLFQLARPLLVQFKIAHLLPLREAAIVYTAVSFRVALRSQPIYAQASLQPFIDFSFALKVLDVPNFGSGVVSLDFPIARRDAVVFEGDPR
jgi:hypothetical protein